MPVGRTWPVPLDTRLELATDSLKGTVMEPPDSAAQQRKVFAADQARGLAAQIDLRTNPAHGKGRSSRFVWFESDQQLTLVVGAQEKGYADLALATGLAEAVGRRLVLVLPEGWHEPTLQRWAWLRDDLDLSVYTHDGASVQQAERPTRVRATELVVEERSHPALYLNTATPLVEELMRWAGDQPELDAAHRGDVRAWHCRGQRVLAIRRHGAGGVEVTAGIDWSDPAKRPPRHQVADDTAVPLDALKTAVRAGIEARLQGEAAKHDEHWLQAVLRRNPQKLGLEQPVLRELPAWRPVGSTRASACRGRGYVDLAGLDATGALVLVETKLGADDMLVLQGLDYWIWAQANRDRLTRRLECHRNVPIEVAYCVGEKAGQQPTLSRHAGGQLAALPSDMRWRLVSVRDWINDAPTCQPHPARTLPKEL